MMLLLLFSSLVVSDSLWTPWTAAHQAFLSLTISPSLPKFMSIASIMPYSHFILWRPLLLLPQSFPASGTFPMSWLFTSGDQNTGASASASVLPMSIQDWFPLRLIWSPCYPRDCQEYSPAPQLEGINFLVLCLLYTPALTTLCDHWEDQPRLYGSLSGE